MPQPDISALYGAHLRAMTDRADQALAAQGYDGLIIASGSLRYLYLDDNSYRDIAGILGLTETNVATKINRLKLKIKEQFTQTNTD